MRTRWCFLAALPALAALAVSARELRQTPLPATIRSLSDFAALVDRVAPGWAARYRVPGVCVGIVTREASDLRCYGTVRADGSRRVDGRSRFAVASVSKTFTALSVLTLAGQGRFGLDDRVEPNLRTWRFPRGQFDGSTVTIRQLLTHTGGVGVPSYGGAVAPSPGETTQDVLDGRTPGREPVTLIAPPGSGFHYSGGGYMVLQQLVEDLSGLPFDRFAAERVFTPMGMTDTGFSWGTVRDGDTAGHDVAGDAMTLYRYGAAMAPGAMVTTGDDMLRFVSAFSTSRLGALLGWPDELWERFTAADQGGYGMALTTGKANGHVLLGHAGTTMGYDAGFTAMPSEGVGWFVLTNGNGGPFLKAELDRLFMEWRTGAAEPRYRVMQWLRAAVAGVGALLTGWGALSVGVFAVSASRRRAWLGAANPGRPRRAVGFALAGLLVLFVASWVVFFHTNAFYPAFTTAWLPYAFRFVSLGVALLALRAALACLFVRKEGDLEIAGLEARATTTRASR